MESSHHCHRHACSAAMWQNRMVVEKKAMVVKKKVPEKQEDAFFSSFEGRDDMHALYMY